MHSDSNDSKNSNIGELLQQFSSASERKKRGLLKSLESRVLEIVEMGHDALAIFDPDGDEWAAGSVLQLLQKHYPESLNNILSSGSSGWFNAPSTAGIEYGPLQQALLEQSFESADRFTSSALRQLAGSGAENRGYVYFSEVESIAAIDLVTIDRLWIAYSQGKFGFTKQASLLKSLDGRYDRLWTKIGWKNEGVWTRYPSSFNWSLNAPEGHMPLVNQLRGVRLMDAILNHPSLIARI